MSYLQCSDLDDDDLPGEAAAAPVAHSDSDQEEHADLKDTASEMNTETVSGVHFCMHPLVGCILYASVVVHVLQRVVQRLQPMCVSVLACSSV